MTADEQGYQGWKNYETWATALWINNERRLQDCALELAQSCDRHADDDENVPEIWTRDEAAQYRLADALKSWVRGDLLPDLGATLAADLLGSAADEIAWDDLAESFLHSLREARS